MSDAKHFQKHIRLYNNAFAFTSMGSTQVPDPIVHSSGVPIVKIGGELYHRIGSLLPVPGVRPRYLQTYVHDEGEDARMAFVRSGMQSRHGEATDQPRLSVIRRIAGVLARINPYVQVLLNNRERLDLAGAEVSLLLTTIEPHAASRDFNRYNRPVAKEVALLIENGSGTHEPYKMDIIVHRRNGSLQRVSEDHSAYLPFRFILLFPFGTQGWTTNLPTGTLHGWVPDPRGNKDTSMSRFSRLKLHIHTAVSSRAWYRFHLHPRANLPLPTIHYGRKLFQEFIITGYASIEQRELKYLTDKLGNHRMETHSRVQEAVMTGAALRHIGTRRILSAQHVGSPRYMSSQYHDCMAIVRALGNPSLFITFTCNPKWREIEEAVQAGFSPHDRPDIACRVFHLKLRALLEDIWKEKIFGTVIGGCYVVEFQKRGLPHAHILLILEERARPTTVEQVDNMVCATLPDKDAEPELWTTVVNCMLHAPCGERERRRGEGPRPCMREVNGRLRCRFNYPKDFNDGTTFDENGWVKYGRPDDGRSHFDPRSEYHYTNRDVVPYNRWLSKKYDAHINVEIASVRESVKYLFKYIHKGHTRSIFSISEGDGPVRNEIREYLDGRYLAACEAFWRLFSYTLTDHKPTVKLLDVHLPGEQLVTFNDFADPQELLDNARKSTLDEFFKYCQENPRDVEGLLYLDCPSKLVWKNNSRWQKRVGRGTDAVGRIRHVAPSAGEVGLSLQCTL